MIHGARIIQIQGNFDQALNIVKELCSEDEFELVNSINPFRLEGQKTAAMEVCDQLGRAPNPSCASGWGTPATSQPIGRAIKNTELLGKPRAFPR